MFSSSPLKKVMRCLRRTYAPPAYSTQRDKVLARKLYAALERDLKLAEVQDLHFYTYRGTVTIYGTIHRESDRHLLISLVRQIPGVKSVVAHVQVLEHKR